MVNPAAQRMQQHGDKPVVGRGFYQLRLVRRSPAGQKNVLPRGLTKHRFAFSLSYMSSTLHSRRHHHHHALGVLAVVFESAVVQ